MNTFKLIVSTPDGNAFCGDVSDLSLRGTEGDLAVMAGHIPFATAVKEGECSITFEDETVKKARTGTGILTVSKDETVLLTGSFEFEE